MTTRPEARGMDPFSLIFPKMTKCTFNTYGPSGSIQNYDGLCVLPINILNEKIYLVTWFVLFALGLFTIIYSIIALFILSLPTVRYQFLCIYLSPKRKALRKKLCRILDMTSIGDWLMLYMLAKNLNRVTFSDVIDNVKYPDYDFDADEADPENVELEKLHSINNSDDKFA